MKMIPIILAVLLLSGCSVQTASEKSTEQTLPAADHETMSTTAEIVTETPAQSSEEAATKTMVEATEPETTSAAPAGNSFGDRELPIYCVETDEKKISLSLDAAWGDEDTQKILDILEKHNINVTFFMTGGWVDSYPEDVRAIYAAGHDLGNHSEHHEDMPALSVEQQEEELLLVHDKVKELTGYDMFLFRPPYGSYSNELIQNARGLGYYTIQWDVDSLDWKNHDAQTIIDTICNHNHLGNGSIILCHNSGEHTAEALDRLIPILQEMGYEFVPISQLIIRDHYHMNFEGRQIADPDGGVPEQ